MINIVIRKTNTRPHIYYKEIEHKEKEKNKLKDEEQ